MDPAWGAFAQKYVAPGLSRYVFTPSLCSLAGPGLGYEKPRKGRNNDKAHPPIHPTAHAGNLTGDEKKVYEYVTRRFLACCSKDAKGFETTVDVECGGEEFSAIGMYRPSFLVACIVALIVVTSVIRTCHIGS